MYSGQHGPFMWEITGGELVISSRNPHIGELQRQPAANRFNNAEQATWFAQGQIDMQSQSLAALLTAADAD